MTVLKTKKVKYKTLLLVTIANRRSRLCLKLSATAIHGNGGEEVGGHLFYLMS